MRKQKVKSTSSHRSATAPPRITHRYFLNVAGASFNNDDGSERQKIISRCKVGDELLLIREPNNRFDPGAIKVTRLKGQQIGYLPASVTCHGDSSGLASQIDTGMNYRCRIADISGGVFGVWFGVKVEITDGDWQESGT